MLDQEDLKWVASTSTELNTMLQQISRTADQARQSKGESGYIDLLSEQAQAASKTAQSLFDRVTLKILEKSSQGVASAATPDFGQSNANSKVAATGAIPADIKVQNENGPRELILLVEDEDEIAELASLMLTDEGYKVILAHDGFEALRIYQQISKQVGLVILDFFLPVMDGDAVFDELRALNPNVAVVLSSGFKEQSKLGNMLSQGLRGFIPKPYTRERLLEQVRSTIDAPR
jgi:CheY-like chemotaxis protein